MSLITPPAKLPDDRTQKWPSYLFHPVLSAFFCQLQPEQQAPGPCRREAILSSAVISGASKYQHAKSQILGN